MSNKYIEKFFLLTEQNILASSNEIVNDCQQNFEMIRKNDKYNGYVKYFLGSLIIGLVYFLIHNTSHKISLTKIRPLLKLAAESEVQRELGRKNAVHTSVHDDSSIESKQQLASAVEFPNRSIMSPKLNNVKMLTVADEKTLLSSIPGFRVGARHQFLQQVYLKKLDVAMLDSADFDNITLQKLAIDKVLVVPKSFG